LTSNFFNFYDTPMQSHADHALIADTSLPVSNNPANNSEWAFPSFIPSPSSANVLGDKLQDLLNTFPQSMDAYNPSMTIHRNPTELLQSIDFMPEPQASAQAERAVKQQKLLEIQETARQLEAELAAT
jgi:hypothetical protein